MNATRFLLKNATRAKLIGAILHRPGGGSATTDEKEELKRQIELFLNATVDEVRLRRADEFAAYVLKINRAEDALHFRRGVTRRELGRTIHFPKQRDHSAHTVNNYLLGWVIYQNCVTFRQAFAKAVVARSWGQDAKFGPDRAFRLTWLSASLLHDIGYIFEGSLSPDSSEHQFEHARLGATIVDEYLHSHQWVRDGLYPVSIRRAVREYHKEAFGSQSLGYSVPIASAETLLRLAQNLSDMGPLSAIETELRRSLPEDVFDLWVDHYTAFDAPRMATFVKRARKVYLSFVSDGLPGAGVRVVDHGIASGLIQQLTDTSYYEIWNTLKAANADTKASPVLKSAAAQILASVPDAFTAFDTSAFWAWNTWAAAATGVHNVMQKASSQIFDGVDRLKLADDPLAYLGILVDILQEWDRYTVRREGAFSGALPIQGTEVFLNLEPKTGRVAVKYQSKKVYDDAKRDLDGVLHQWNDLIDLQLP